MQQESRVAGLVSEPSTEVISLSLGGMDCFVSLEFVGPDEVGALLGMTPAVSLRAKRDSLRLRNEQIASSLRTQYAGPSTLGPAMTRGRCHPAPSSPRDHGDAGHDRSTHQLVHTTTRNTFSVT